MPNLEIEKILNNVKRTKNLDYNSYLFYKSTLLKQRKEYRAYSNLVKKENVDNYLECASDYINKSKNYREFLMISQNYEMIEYARGGIIDKNQNELLAENLQLLFQAMDKSKLIDLLISRHNMMCTEGGLEVLNSTKEQVSEEFDYAINSRSKVSSLYLKNAFWLNRYRRVLKDMHFQEEFDESFKDIITKDNLSYLLYMYSNKMKVIKQIFKADICQSEDIATSICEEYGAVYKELFNEIFPNMENDIYEDYKNNYEFERLKGIISIKRNVLTELLLKYQIRDSMTNTLNPDIKQWGIYEEGDMFTLCLEPEGYLLPATFHIPKTEYLDVLSSLHIEKYSFPQSIPLSKITREYKNFQTNILVKPTPEQTKKIKMQSKQNGSEREFLKRVSEQIKGKPHSLSTPNMIEFEIGE